MNNIQHKDITFVMQGAVIPETSEAVNQIKKLMPESTIILSTWRDQDVSNINCDLIVKNDDPGGLDNGSGKVININRMIVSTLNGLKKVKTKYAVRFRTDYTLKNKDFLTHYDKMMATGKANCTWFKQPILTTFDMNYFVLPYCPADFFHFGLSTDLIDLWKTKLAIQADAKYFENKQSKSSLLKPFNLPINNEFERYRYEQYLIVKFLQKKSIDVGFKHRQDNINTNIIMQSAKDLINNFFLVSEDEVNFQWLKQIHIKQNPNPFSHHWYKLHNMNKIQWQFFKFKLIRRGFVYCFREKYGEKAYKFFKRLFLLSILMIFVLLTLI